jgi:hypothetical protein
MYTKEKKNVCVGEGFIGEKPQAPNQALQRIAMLVTVRAPSRTNRAKHVYR